MCDLCARDTESECGVVTDNHRELLTDEGLRLNWAMGAQQMIERVLESSVLASCYWAGIDDQFYMPALPDGSRHLVGYGPW